MHAEGFCKLSVGVFLLSVGFLLVFKACVSLERFFSLRCICKGPQGDDLHNSSVS